MNELIQQARELCEKATPGPWKSKETADYSEIYDNHSWGKALNPLAMVGSNLEDATFIAASRTLVPQLCDALEALTARAEKAEAERDTYKAALQLLELMISGEREGSKEREHSAGVVIAVNRARELLKGE